MHHTSTAAAIAPELAGGVLHIDLAALTDNWRRLRAASGAAECAAVVKANAYGVGQAEAVPALWRAGCRTFFVAHPAEALRARADAPGAVIYVLNGLPPGVARRLAAAGVRPVLGSVAELEEWRREAGDAPAGLQLDTGMSRLGLTEAEAAAVVSQPPAFISLVMSHFVTAEVPDHAMNAAQIARFEAMSAGFGPTPRSLANSSGIMLPQRPHYDLTRPGYALYGGNPTPGLANPMRPVVSLRCRIQQIRHVPQDVTVGYNGRWRARRPSRIAIVSVGYADGFLRSASTRNLDAPLANAHGEPGGAALVAGQLCPFAGVVSMDLLAIDITDVPEGAVAAGDEATLIGDSLDIDTVAERIGTIGYEVLTSLGQRYARIYGADAARPGTATESGAAPASQS